MQAAVACGVPLASLEETLCRPEEGSTLIPNEGVRETYEKFEQDFAQFLQGA